MMMLHPKDSLAAAAKEKVANNTQNITTLVEAVANNNTNNKRSISTPESTTTFLHLRWCEWIRSNLHLIPMIGLILMIVYHEEIIMSILRYQNKELKRTSNKKATNELILDTGEIENSNYKSTISSATSGKIFSGEVIRQWDNTKTKQDKVDITPQNGIIRDGDDCINWAVVTTIFEPSEAVFRQARVSGWCLVVVADKKSPVEYDIQWDKLTANVTLSNFSPSVEYLTPDRQRELWFTRFVDILPWDHFARKNVGYLYAIANGAQRVWDFDDDNSLYWWLKNDLTGVPSLENIVAHIDEVGTALEVVNFTYKVFNPYPLLGGPKTSWPRGFPLQEIKNENAYVARHRGREGIEFTELNVSKGQLGVVQSLANNQPDVDAMYLLTQLEIPFDFEKLPQHDLRPVLVPHRSLTPWNAQATLHFQPALWGLLLPISVPGRVSDIWRSYIVQRICWDIDIRIGFANEPLVAQDRNMHNILGDLESEQQLYQQTSQLVDFLRDWHSPSETLAQRIEELWIELYRRNYIEALDVRQVKLWLRALEACHYQFPKVKRYGPLISSTNDEEIKVDNKALDGSNVTMSKCPGVPRLTVWTSDLHDGTRGDIPTILADLGMNVILGGIKRGQGPFPGVFKKVSVYDGDLGTVINKYTSHSTPLSDDDIKANFEFWKDNPMMQSVDLFYCSFPSSMCELWLPFNKSVAFVPGHRYALGRCSLETRKKLDTRLQNMMKSTNPKHIFGALSKYDKEYLEYYLPPTKRIFETYATGFGYLYREAFEPGPSLYFNRTEILSVRGPSSGDLPKGIVDIRSIYNHYTGAQLQQHPGIVLWAYSVMSYKLIDFYALSIPLYVPSLKYYQKNGFGQDRSITWSNYYCNNSTLSLLLDKDPDSLHPISPESPNAGEDELYWLQFSDFYTFPHVTYFDDIEDLGQKIKQNNPLTIRLAMMNENKRRLNHTKKQICDALIGVEANRQTPATLGGLYGE